MIVDVEWVKLGVELIGIGLTAFIIPRVNRIQKLVVDVAVLKQSHIDHVAADEINFKNLGRDVRGLSQDMRRIHPSLK